MYSYDLLGNPLLARNRVGWIRRTFYADGSIRAERIPPAS